jgi:hypothetical protein
MNLKRLKQLQDCHVQGYKVKKIAECLGIPETHALNQMNVYLHAKYGKRQLKAIVTVPLGVLTKER